MPRGCRHWWFRQDIVAPGERMIDDAGPLTAEVGAGAPKAMKFDLRACTYDGAVQWVAARRYQGQTTNFRTPGATTSREDAARGIARRAAATS